MHNHLPRWGDSFKSTITMGDGCVWSFLKIILFFSPILIDIHIDTFLTIISVFVLCQVQKTKC